MFSLFGKKEEMQAMAEVLEDGLAIMNQEMQKAKYNNYKGAEPMLSVRVRVQPKDDAPFESAMQVGMTNSYLLKPGVLVKVKYQKGKTDEVTFDDELLNVLEKNAAILKKG